MVTKVNEVLGPDRIRVGNDHGMQSLVIQRSDLMMNEKLKAGDIATGRQIGLPEGSLTGAAPQNVDPETVAHLVAPNLRGDVGARLHDLIRKDLVRPERTPEGDACRDPPCATPERVVRTPP